LSSTKGKSNKKATNKRRHPLQEPLKKINYTENGDVENGNDTKQYKIYTKKMNK
jgi:hypothetical protein